jgi:hypothetical protein
VAVQEGVHEGRLAHVILRVDAGAARSCAAGN